MANGNVSIQTSGGGSTLGVISASGYGLSFLNPLYRYANLTLPYSPNDPGLSFTYDNSSLAPTVLLYARFFNLLNEASVPLVVNVGTSAFAVTGGPAASGAADCLDVRAFGAVGDGVADDTAAIQAALNQAYSNFLGNQIAAGTSSSQASRPVQSVPAHIENGSGTKLQFVLQGTPTLGNTFILTFCAFDYGAGPNSPDTPQVSDNRGGVWQLDGVGQNGEVLLYVYHAQVAAAAGTTVTIQMQRLQFNSFIGGVCAEFSGLLSPVTIDGSVAAVEGHGSFTPPSLPPSNKGDLAIYSVVFTGANGFTPVPPGDFTLVGSQLTPRPNGLNGALPVTAMAYKNWSGKTTINSSWSSPSFLYDGAAVIVAYRQVPLPPGPPGKTVVCIPNGVSCMVSPQPNFDHPRSDPVWIYSTGFTAGYGHSSFGYSLVMSDGVTLRIDGSIVANPNVNGSAIPGNAGGEFGWVLITNSAWLLNTSLAKQLVQPDDFVTEYNGFAPIIPWSSYIAGAAFNEGPRNTGIKVTGSGKVYLNGQIQANLPVDTVVPPSGFEPMGFVRFICVDNSTIENLELINPWSIAIQWGHSEGAVVSNLYIHDAPAQGGEFGTVGGGIIEMDMLRNSKITNNRILSCPNSIGISDYAGYQNVVFGNSIDNCFSGYLYYDMGFEWTWVFGAPMVNGVPQPSYKGASYTSVTHNTEISQNKATNCKTSQPFPQALYDSGSDGFGFFSGYGKVLTQMGPLPVLGTSFHDNIATGNSTDVFYGSLTAFRSFANNTFSGGTLGGSGGGVVSVSNGQNTVTGETPTGVINGVNKIFVLAHVPTSLAVYLNGLLQYPGTDYTVSGNAITLAVAPNSGSVLTVNYSYTSGS